MASRYKVEHIAKKPRGWKVRTVTVNPRKANRHLVRVAFPPGRRKKGSGKLLEVLHPRGENPSCEVAENIKKNPAELLVFGNPTKRNQEEEGYGNHKPGCECAFCERARGLESGEIQPPALPNRSRRRQKKQRGSRSTQANGGNIRHPKRRRKNQSDTEEAVQLYQSFHGRDPQGIVEKQVSAAVRLDYTSLGDLDYLKVITPLGDKATFTFEGDGVKLAAAPPDSEGKSRQLYCIGGNQNILPCLDEDSQRPDFIDLGECLEVQYVARKVHAQFRPVSYYHHFGEVNGARPQLMFDKLKKQIFFVGGEYFIDASNGVSPGIEN